MMGFSQEIKNDLLKSGFVPKVEKSCQVPVQNLDILGIASESEKNPQRGIEKTFKTLKEIEGCLHSYRRSM